MRDPRFDVLFEPIKLGPVTAPNRFYQVPHCSGMGYGNPNTLNAMREIKAEGGWGVVNTEYCSIHPSSDDLPAPFASLWDANDTRNMANMVARVKAHGALAGVELWHGGQRASNHHSRLPSWGTASVMTQNSPWQCQAMDKTDIKNYRAYHVAAARRAVEAGFDIVYVYAAHSYLLAQFLDPDLNQRIDEYGGSFENRNRLFREVVEDTRAIVDGKAALATRIEICHDNGEGRDERSLLLQAVAPLIDLFDVTVPNYNHEMGASRFIKEASLEDYISHVRKITGKPVVSVGRFTSPETMLSQIKRGIVDLIGAARPSIADPFLPSKIKEGRMDDIRECIGCNICYAHNEMGVPIRCTQNPTMGEEWRSGWHPERVPEATVKDTVLVIGAGPAGLEATLTFGKRGLNVMLAEASEMLGGRINNEIKLPGLAEWARVRDWRVGQIEKRPNIEVFRASSMSKQDVMDTGVDHVVIATGSHWRKNGQGRTHISGQKSFHDPRTISPDELLAGFQPQGHVVIFDDENYYMAASLAERIAMLGQPVTYVTTEGIVAAWAAWTIEQAPMQTRLLQLGVKIIVSSSVAALKDKTAVIENIYANQQIEIACDCFVPVTSREPNDVLWQELQTANLKSLVRIGDCRAPGILAQAVYDGHKIAREFGVAAENIIRRREFPEVNPINCLARQSVVLQL